MSLCTLGFAEEFKPYGIAANSLWPRTTIATAAVRNVLGGGDMMRRSRDPRIVAEAAYAIVTRPSKHGAILHRRRRDHRPFGLWRCGGELQTDLFL
jgi:NAD(P)-dependent dehydrogenase (short-subunit alcohol dehydrogenase family)